MGVQRLLGQRQVHRVPKIKSILVTRSRTKSERTLCLFLHPQDGQTSPRSRGMGTGLVKNASPSCKHPRRGRGHCSNHSEGNEIRFGPFGRRKANYGKIVKTAVRELWSLEYEIEEIQTEFAKGIGSIDIANLTDDFVEDVMLQSKPLQGILMAIRLRQKEKMEQIKAKYWDGIKDLEPLNAPRPPKPKDEPKPAAAPADAAPAPAEPAPAAPAAAPEVTASA